MYGEKRATIIDVAVKAGVSRTSVSRVLNGRGEITPETRQRIVAAIDELGYRPSEIARSLSSRRTHTVGIIVYDLLNPGMAETVNYAQVRLAQEGYRTILACMSGRMELGETCLSLLDDRRVDGIIITNPMNADPHAPGARVLPELARNGANCYHPATRRVSRVTFEEFRGGFQAADHLLDLGHREIGVLVGPRNWGLVGPRLEGVTAAIERRGFGVGPDYIETASAWSTSEGYVAAGRLLDRAPNLTAILALYDLLAMGAARAVADRGKKIPDDVAVIGYNDVVFASYIIPRLSTIRADCCQMGTVAAELMLELLNDEETPAREVQLPTDLVVRESTVRSAGEGLSLSLEAPG